MYLAFIFADICCLRYNKIINNSWCLTCSMPSHYLNPQWHISRANIRVARCLLVRLVEISILYLIFVAPVKDCDPDCMLYIVVHLPFPRFSYFIIIYIYIHTYIWCASIYPNVEPFILLICTIGKLLDVKWIGKFVSLMLKHFQDPLVNGYLPQIHYAVHNCYWWQVPFSLVNTKSNLPHEQLTVT